MCMNVNNKGECGIHPLESCAKRRESVATTNNPLTIFLQLRFSMPVRQSSLAATTRQQHKHNNNSTKQCPAINHFILIHWQFVGVHLYHFMALSINKAPTTLISTAKWTAAQWSGQKKYIVNYSYLRFEMLVFIWKLWHHFRLLPNTQFLHKTIIWLSFINPR